MRKLEDLSWPELKKLAKQLGVKVDPKLKKGELILEVKLRKLATDKCKHCGELLFQTPAEYREYVEKVRKVVEAGKVKPQEIILRSRHKECRGVKKQERDKFFEEDLVAESLVEEKESGRIKETQMISKLKGWVREIDWRLTAHFLLAFLIGFLLRGCLRR